MRVVVTVYICGRRFGPSLNFCFFDNVCFSPKIIWCQILVGSLSKLAIFSISHYFSHWLLPIVFPLTLLFLSTFYFPSRCMVNSKKLTRLPLSPSTTPNLEFFWHLESIQQCYEICLVLMDKKKTFILHNMLLSWFGYECHFEAFFTARNIISYFFFIKKIVI